jgi:ABC-type glycerol-3-phosphate transport system substrate-binding protein
VLRVSRVPWPAFDQVSRAIDILGDEVHRALLGLKAPKQALDDAAKAITPLVPKV